MHQHALLLAAACAATLVPACNLVAFQEARLDQRMSEAGLALHATTVEEAHVQYWSWGTGPPMVLLHGFGGDAHWQWAELAEELSSTYTVTAPDLVWFGGSASPRHDYTIQYQAEIMSGLLEQLGLDCVTVVGSSYGGFVALALAQEHPDRIGRLVLVDSPGPSLDRVEVAALKDRFHVRALDELFVPRDPEALRRLLDASYVDPPFTPYLVLPAVLQALYVPHEVEKRDMIRNLAPDLERLGERLSRAPFPTLLIWGREDVIFPPRLGEDLADRLGTNARLAVVEEAGHVPNLEQPEAFSQVLQAFLERTPSACAASTR